MSRRPGLVLSSTRTSSPAAAMEWIGDRIREDGADRLLGAVAGRLGGLRVGSLRRGGAGPARHGANDGERLGNIQTRFFLTLQNVAMHYSRIKTEFPQSASHDAVHEWKFQDLP